MNDPDRVREWLARWEAADDDLALLVDTGGRITIGDLRALAVEADQTLKARVLDKFADYCIARNASLKP